MFSFSSQSETSGSESGTGSESSMGGSESPKSGSESEIGRSESPKSGSESAKTMDSELPKGGSESAKTMDSELPKGGSESPTRSDSDLEKMVQENQIQKLTEMYDKDHKYWTRLIFDKSMKVEFLIKANEGLKQEIEGYKSKEEWHKMEMKKIQLEMTRVQAEATKQSAVHRKALKEAEKLHLIGEETLKKQIAQMQKAHEKEISKLIKEKEKLSAQTEQSKNECLAALDRENQTREMSESVQAQAQQYKSDNEELLKKGLVCDAKYAFDEKRFQKTVEKLEKEKRDLERERTLTRVQTEKDIRELTLKYEYEIVGLQMRLVQPKVVDNSWIYERLERLEAKTKEKIKIARELTSEVRKLRKHLDETELVCEKQKERITMMNVLLERSQKAIQGCEDEKEHLQRIIKKGKDDVRMLSVENDRVTDANEHLRLSVQAAKPLIKDLDKRNKALLKHRLSFERDLAECITLVGKPRQLRKKLGYLKQRYLDNVSQTVNVMSQTEQFLNNVQKTCVNMVETQWNRANEIQHLKKQHMHECIRKENDRNDALWELNEARMEVFKLRKQLKEALVQLHKHSKPVKDKVWSWCKKKILRPGSQNTNYTEESSVLDQAYVQTPACDEEFIYSNIYEPVFSSEMTPPGLPQPCTDGVDNVQPIADGAHSLPFADV